MILTGDEIRKQVTTKRITIEPFDQRFITTNSYDFHLGGSLLVYENKILDVKVRNKTKTIKLTSSGYVLQPDKIYLGHTQEHLGSEHYVPIIRGKSSTGRIGLFVHITADLIDIGSVNQYTLMLYGVQPVRVYPGMLIGQVTFWEVKGEIKQLYNGKYKNLSGPQPSQIFRDFPID